MIPSKKKEPAKQPTRTGEKQQPARISWNEWAGPAAVDQAKRAAEMREMEKKDASLLADKGAPMSDGRKHREMGGNNSGLSSGRYGRPAVDVGRSHHRDHRRFGVRDPGGGGGGRERSPNRRSYRTLPYSRSGEGNVRRGTAASRGAMPPGMNYGKAPTTHFVNSGSLKTVHPSARPIAAQGMPPGLGVTGSATAAPAAAAPPPRNLARPSQHPPPVEHRRAAMKDGHLHRSRSPPQRPERFSRQGSLPRYDKYQRPHQSPPPRHPDALPPPVHRSRSPPPNRDGVLPYTDRPSVQRQPSQRGSSGGGGGGGSRSQLPMPQQPQRQEHLPHVPYRGQRLDNGPSLRLRDGVPASPRRFIPPVRYLSPPRF